jgi:hypothetical protein
MDAQLQMCIQNHLAKSVQSSDAQSNAGTLLFKLARPPELSGLTAPNWTVDILSLAHHATEKCAPVFT